MSVNIRYPNITASSDREQLSQIKSYLHQLVDQLNYALPQADGSAQPTSTSVQGEEMSYYDLRSLIIQQLQEVDSLFNQLSNKMETEYVRNDALEGAVEAKIAEARDNGELFTEEDIASVATQAAGKILFTLDEEGNLYYELEE